MSYARRVDDGQKAIVKAFREMGCTVLHLFREGDDAPDLLVGTCGIDQLVEVKSANGSLSEGQFKFHQDWRGSRPVVIRTVKEAALLVGEMGERARRKA